MSDPNYTPGGSSPTGGVTISGEANMMLQQFWPKTISNIRSLKQVNLFFGIDFIIINDLIT